MSKELRQSTAVTVKYGPFVDNGDGFTPETGLTIQKADVRLSKNGGNMAAAHADQGESDAGAPHDEIGYYDVSLDTTDTDTLGRLKIMTSKTGALSHWDEYTVLPANVFDSLIAGSASLKIDLDTIKTRAVTCGAAVTIHPAVGSDYKLGVDSDGYISSASDVDAQMLEEAIRQGYREGIDVIVPYAATPADRGTALLAVYATAKARTPYSAAISATNPVNIYLPPWWYDVGASSLTLDTSFVNLIALYPEMGGHRQATDNDVSDGSTSLNEFRPPRTVIYSATADTTVVTQSAQVVACRGFAVAQLSGDATGTYHAYYVSDDTNAGSVYDQMYFWHKAPYSVYETAYRYPIGFAKHVAGLWTRCISNSLGWRIGYDVGNAGIFSATMIDIETGSYSIIGDYPDKDTKGDHFVIGCYLLRVKAIGCLGGGSSGYASINGCDYWSNDVADDCYFIECETGDRGYGIGCVNYGNYFRCRGKDYCLSSTTRNVGVGEDAFLANFAGYAEDCTFGKGSAGGRKANIGAYGKLTGKLVRCKIIGSELPHRIEGAIIENSLLTVATNNQDCITLLDSNSKISKSTLLVVQGGTGIPINAASALNVCAVGNSYNNLGAAGQTNGLGANVTNVGNEATTTTTADKSATATAAATAILATPANKLVTDAAGAVDMSKIGGSTDSLTRFKASVDALTVANVVDVLANDEITFYTNLPAESDNYYGNSNAGMVLAFISGTTNAFQARRVIASTTETALTIITLEEALDATPASGDTFILLGRITELS